MKKMIAVLLALVLCLSMATVVMAAEDDFVGSITVKPAPGVIPPEGHDSCIIITPVSDVDDADIPESSKEKLKEVYEDILNDEEDFSEVPGLDDLVKDLLGEDATTDDLVVRDLFDVTITCDDLKEKLPFDLTFDANLKKDDTVIVLEYQDGKWQLVDSKNNGDGTVTAQVANEGPVAILVPGAKTSGPAGTGDTTNQQMVLWIAVAALALVSIAVLLATYRRREEDAE